MIEKMQKIYSCKLQNRQCITLKVAAIQNLKTIAEAFTMDEIFKQDEMELKTVNPKWTKEELLEQDGLFFLKDIVDKLEITKTEVINACRHSTKKEGENWNEIGVRKVWTHYMVRMKLFAPYYRRATQNKTKKVKPEWDANTLLKQDGLFKMVDVVKKLPFSAHQLRHLTRQTENSRETIGVFKKDGNFLIDMKFFRKYVKKIWLEGFD